MLLLLLLLCVHRCNCIVMPKLKNEYKNNHFIYRRNSFVFNDDDNITATAPMVARTYFILQMHTGTIRSTLVACATVRSMFFAFVITSCFPLISCCRWLFFAFIFLSGFFVSDAHLCLHVISNGIAHQIYAYDQRQWISPTMTSNEHDNHQCTRLMIPIADSEIAHKTAQHGTEEKKMCE